MNRNEGMRILVFKNQSITAMIVSIIAIVLFLLLSDPANATGQNYVPWERDPANSEISEPVTSDSQDTKEETKQTPYENSNFPIPAWIGLILALTFSVLLLSASLGYIWRRSH